MGLDITAHRKIGRLDLSSADPDNLADAAYEAGGFVAYLNPDFPGRADEITDRAAYGAEESFDFRAGGYGGYNEWRDKLAALAGYAAVGGDDERHRHSRGAWTASAGPFWELINYSDCEGVIGAAVGAKLAKDFAELQPKVEELTGPDSGWFAARYADWRKAFDMAADGGCVVFH